MSRGNKTQAEWKPVVNSLLHNLSAIVDPASYTGIAGHAYQVAARYGSVREPSPGMLQLGVGQAPLSGMGILSHIEILNEPNGWWRGREGFMKPFEIASMLSATYVRRAMNCKHCATEVAWHPTGTTHMRGALHHRMAPGWVSRP